MGSESKISTAEMWYSQGVEAYKAGKHEESLVAFARALSADPKYYRALVFQGLAQMELKSYDDARRALEAAVQLAPTYAKAHNALGNVYRRTGDIDLAIQAFAKSADLEPRVAEYHYNIGISRLDINHVPEAIDALKAAARYAPKDVDIQTELASAFMRNKAYHDAVQVLEDFVNRCPDHDRAVELKVRISKLKKKIEDEKAAADAPPPLA